MVTRTIDLPESLLSAIEEAARVRSSSEDEVIREVLTERFLNVDGEPLPGWVGMANDSTISGAEDAEWLETHWTPE